MTFKLRFTDSTKLEDGTSASWEEYGCYTEVVAVIEGIACTENAETAHLLQRLGYELYLDTDQPDGIPVIVSDEPVAEAEVPVDEPEAVAESETEVDTEPVTTEEVAADEVEVETSELETPTEDPEPVIEPEPLVVVTTKKNRR